MKERLLPFLKKFLFILALMAFASLLMLAYMYPHHPESTLGWIVLFLASLPALILWVTVAGFFNKHVMEGPFTAKMSSLGRIAYGVIIVSSIFALFIIINELIDPYFGWWGF